MSKFRLILLSSAVSIMALSLFACDSKVVDDDSGDDDGTATPTAQPTPTAVPTPTAAATLATCSTSGSNSLAVNGTLTCADTTTTMDWDWYTVAVQAGDCIDIKVDNDATAMADLLAIAVDANGVTYYGQASDYSQLDDEWACSNTPWDSFGCPERSVVAATTGDFVVLVGQWGGGGTTPGTDACYDNAGYTLWVAVNGTDVSPTLTADDTPLQ